LYVLDRSDPLRRRCAVNPINADVPTLFGQFLNDTGAQVQLAICLLNVLDKRLVRSAIRSTNRSEKTRIADECCWKRGWMGLTHRQAGMAPHRLRGREPLPRRHPRQVLGHGV